MSRHIPVLLKETIENLNLARNADVVDCTLGDAGHAEAALHAIGPKGRLLGIDADAEAILRAKRFLYSFGNRVTYARANFADLAQTAQENKFSQVRGIMMDLGWSTPQFEERGRGFSFEKSEPLDMRYNVKAHCSKNDFELGCLTAYEIVNNWKEAEIAQLLTSYGEEPLAKQIAAAINIQRQVKPISDSAQLAALVVAVYRNKLKSDNEVPWVGGTHPATRTFQALRIAVNDELGVLKKVLPQAVELLASGGRLAVISFHSLEDRIVKQFFQKHGRKTLKIITKKPITASERELKNNPRARSAKLRVAEKN